MVRYLIPRFVTIMQLTRRLFSPIVEKRLKDQLQREVSLPEIC
jgi:hypothetical protein